MRDGGGSPRPGGGNLLDAWETVTGERHTDISCRESWDIEFI